MAKRKLTPGAIGTRLLSFSRKRTKTYNRSSAAENQIQRAELPTAWQKAAQTPLIWKDTPSVTPSRYESELAYSDNVDYPVASETDHRETTMPPSQTLSQREPASRQQARRSPQPQQSSEAIPGAKKTPPDLLRILQAHEARVEQPTTPPSSEVIQRMSVPADDASQPTKPAETMNLPDADTEAVSQPSSLGRRVAARQRMERAQQILQSRDGDAPVNRKPQASQSSTSSEFVESTPLPEDEFDAWNEDGVAAAPDIDTDEVRSGAAFIAHEQRPSLTPQPPMQRKTMGSERVTDPVESLPQTAKQRTPQQRAEKRHQVLRKLDAMQPDEADAAPTQPTEPHADLLDVSVPEQPPQDHQTDLDAPSVASPELSLALPDVPGQSDSDSLTIQRSVLKPEADTGNPPERPLGSRRSSVSQVPPARIVEYPTTGYGTTGDYPFELSRMPYDSMAFEDTEPFNPSELEDAVFQPNAMVQPSSKPTQDAAPINRQEHLKSGGVPTYPTPSSNEDQLNEVGQDVPSSATTHADAINDRVQYAESSSSPSDVSEKLSPIEDSEADLRRLLDLSPQEPIVGLEPTPPSLPGQRQPVVADRIGQGDSVNRTADTNSPDNWSVMTESTHTHTHAVPLDEALLGGSFDDNIQRAMEDAETMSSEMPPLVPNAEADEVPEEEEKAEDDVNRLARDVYRLLRDKLRAERERNK